MGGRGHQLVGKEEGLSGHQGESGFPQPQAGYHQVLALLACGHWFPSLPQDPLPGLGFGKSGCVEQSRSIKIRGRQSKGVRWEAELAGHLLWMVLEQAQSTRELLGTRRTSVSVSPGHFHLPLEARKGPRPGFLPSLGLSEGVQRSKLICPLG